MGIRRVEVKGAGFWFGLKLVCMLHYSSKRSRRMCRRSDAMPQFGSKKNSAKPFGLRRGVPKRSSVEGGANLNDALSGHGGRLAGSGHIAWFDYAKGICIILVVMMHSTLGVGEAFAAKGLASEGFMHWVVAYAKPFRMPDFFMLAGLFLSFAINRSWMHYLDKKVVHFAYFYVIWTIIQAAIKTAAIQGLDGAALASTFLGALINPYPTLWFIYVLPLFFVATKLLHGVPAWLMLAGAAIVHTLPIHSGWSAIDQFAAHYYVFFLGGYLLAPRIFKVAAWAGQNSGRAAALIAVWALLNGAFAFCPSPLPGWSNLAELPVISIVLGGMGAMAIVLLASQLSKFDAAPLIRYCGANSIVLYISFTIPMAFTRVLIVNTGVIDNTGVASLIVWLVAVTTPLMVHLALRRTPLRFLYERPSWAVLPYQQADQSKVRVKTAVVAPH